MLPNRLLGQPYTLNHYMHCYGHDRYVHRRVFVSKDGFDHNLVRPEEALCVLG